MARNRTTRHRRRRDRRAAVSHPAVIHPASGKPASSPPPPPHRIASPTSSDILRHPLRSARTARAAVTERPSINFQSVEMMILSRLLIRRVWRRARPLRWKSLGCGRDCSSRSSTFSRFPGRARQASLLSLHSSWLWEREANGRGKSPLCPTSDVFIGPFSLCPVF